MTNQEIVEMQRRRRRLTERSKTIVADLMDLSMPSTVPDEAAEIIEWLTAQIQSLRQEIKDGQRAAGDAYAQGQQDGYDKFRLA